MDSQLKKGLLEVCVLKAVSEVPSYGYKIIGSLSGVVDISESTLYTILKRLEVNNCLQTQSKEENGRLRKYYLITQSGKNKIQDFVDCAEEFGKIITFIRSSKEVLIDEDESGMA